MLSVVCRMELQNVQGGSNMTGTDVTRFTRNQSRSYLNHLIILIEHCIERMRACERARVCGCVSFFRFFIE